ncbi:MAG: acyl transferase [Chitinophagaceae bacterium]|nr:acyl transferase [Chitinophagaceae bacterium]
MALELFQFQYQYNTTYRQFVNSLHVNPENVDSITKIPFLPIRFFKTNTIKTTDFEPEIIFESSGTTQSGNSHHYVKNIELYKKCFTQCFELFYGPENEWCILALLPSYLERKNSSLITMTEELIKRSGHSLSGFYLKDNEKLYQTLLHNEILQQPTLLIGVTFALLNFTENYTMHLSNTVIMETGGMKGRREEITREEVHETLVKKLGVRQIHSEYGMTEILSQAYSRGNGIFKCPPWMKILIRSEDDPFSIQTASLNTKKTETGIINIIDLANIYSCAFIATDDMGKLHHNGSFEVLGRCDNSDIRGCSLLIS